jgi:glycosyltransferase involved in cell wall biosynthesis
MRREWAVNGRFLTQKTTGVQRYAREIVRAIDGLMADGHPLAQGLNVEVLVPLSYRGRLPKFRRIVIRAAGRSRGHLWEQLVLPRHARGGLLNLCNVAPVWQKKQIVCIHDLNPILFPLSYSFPFRAAYSLLLPILGRVAASISTVSTFSAELLMQHGITRDRLPVVIPDGHEHVFEWNSCGSPPTDPLVGSNTILILGSLAPHKNISIVLELAPKLAAYGLNIAVVGSRDLRVFSQQSTEAGPHQSVMWLGSLSDDELAGLMQRCLCLAFPSLMEGFGLPPLEAMALGCPVVVSTCASLPEVCGDAALYASPIAPDAWMDCFISLRDKPSLRRELISKGKARAAKFSWHRSAELYLELLARLDGLDVPVPSRLSPAGEPPIAATG